MRNSCNLLTIPVKCKSAQRYHQLCSSLLILIDYNENTKYESRPSVLYFQVHTGSTCGGGGGEISSPPHSRHYEDMMLPCFGWERYAAQL